MSRKTLSDAFVRDGGGAGIFLAAWVTPYMGHPMAAAAGLAVQQVIARDNLLANVQANGRDTECAVTSDIRPTCTCGGYPGQRVVSGC